MVIQSVLGSVWVACVREIFEQWMRAITMGGQDKWSGRGYWSKEYQENAARVGEVGRSGRHWEKECIVM